jgi:hypothetical protein
MVAFVNKLIPQWRDATQMVVFTHPYEGIRERTI